MYDIWLWLYSGTAIPADTLMIYAILSTIPFIIIMVIILHFALKTNLNFPSGIALAFPTSFLVAMTLSMTVFFSGMQYNKQFFDFKSQYETAGQYYTIKHDFKGTRVHIKDEFTNYIWISSTVSHMENIPLYKEN